ncbi:MAG: tetratricopeptide repeat protein [Planctomycetota bacterium]
MTPRTAHATPIARNPRRAALYATAALVLALTPPDAAHAQVASGEAGRALDANQQVGGGRVNALDPNQNIDYAARNNLITGNVAGGRGFRGEVNYSAPGEFGFNRSSTGTSSLFDFSAASIASSPQVQGATFIGPQSDQTVGVFSNFNTVGAARVNRPFTVTGSASGIGEVARFTPDASFSATGTSRTIGLGRTADGGLARLYASPLLGLRQSTIEANPLAVSPVAPGTTNASAFATDEDGSADDVPGRIDGSFNPEGDTTEPAPDEPVDPATVLPNSGEQRFSFTVEPVSQLDARLNAITGNRSAANAAAQRSGGSGLGAMLGRQIRGEYDPTVNAGSIMQRRLEAEAARLTQAPPPIADEPTTTDEPDDGTPAATLTLPPSPYEALLDEARRRAAGETRIARADGGLGPTLPGRLSAPEEERVRGAEATRRRAIEDALGVDGQTSEAQARDEVLQGEAVQDLLNLLDYDLPALETLAAQNENRVDEALRAGEEALSVGNYVEAERQYSRAVSLAPDRPLVRIGLVHAQLGAGMFRSAAFNLRRVFADHPELIAARYAARLLPPQDRLEDIASELQRLATGQRSASDAGVLLGYLGYQTDSQALTRFGLAVAEASDPRQDLMPLLREIWLEEQAADESDE